ncbi:TetR/AcrR family transcriptional regulator [Streptacidiphilus monticola]
MVEAALTVIDTEGMDALNMRRVAQELGTGAASLYAHVSNKDELIALVMERVAAALPRPEPEPGRWREQLTEFLIASRDNLAAHGDLARAALTANIPTTPAMLDSAETVLRLLRAGGFDDQVIAYAVDLLALYVVATAYEQGLRTSPWRQEQGDAEAYIAGIRSFFSSLPPDRYPLVVALAPQLTRAEGDERFQFGLDVILDGLAAQQGRW